MKTLSCPCGSGLAFPSCCGPFLAGEKTPDTPEQLMRSRYTAYALGGHGRYLLQTWFPPTAQGLDETELSNPDVTWQKLEVIHHSQEGDQGTVEFKAHFIGQDNQPGILHEKSVFTRIGGRWLYIGGEVAAS